MKKYILHIFILIIAVEIFSPIGGVSAAGEKCWGLTNGGTWQPSSRTQAACTPPSLYQWSVTQPAPTPPTPTPTPTPLPGSCWQLTNGGTWQPNSFSQGACTPPSLYQWSVSRPAPIPTQATRIPNTSMPSIKNPFDTLQVTIPGMKKFTEAAPCPNDPTKICTPWISEYIAGIYKYAIGIVGILAAVVLMIGGTMWVVAGGSSTMISEAKSWISASLTGLVIALCSYLILYQVNPALVGFSPLGISKVEKKEITFSKDNCKWISKQCSGNYTEVDAKNCDPNSIPAASITDPFASYLCCCQTITGTCQPVDTGLCSSSNFSAWGNLAQTASAVCQAESSGQCICNEDTWSCGPMQFHLGSGGITDNAGVDCKDYVENLGPGDPARYGYAWTRWGIKAGYEDKVKNECKNKTCDIGFFPGFALQKYNSQGWGAWSITLSGQKCYNLTHQ
jgi:hypothetical protein